MKEKSVKDPDTDILMFFNGHEDVLALFGYFENLLAGTFPTVNRRVQKTQITFFNRHVFACVSFAKVKRKAELPDGYMVITIGLPRPLDSERAAVITEAYPGRWTHHFVISSPEELDEELVSWIRESYAFANTKGRF